MDLLEIAKSLVVLLENNDVTCGICCCGDDMDRHLSAMNCGHEPVDYGAHSASLLLKAAKAAIGRAEGK